VAAAVVVAAVAVAAAVVAVKSGVKIFHIINSMEEKAMFTHMLNQKRRWVYCFGFAIIAVAMVVAGLYRTGIAEDVKQAKQKSFPSPEEAVKRLMDAVKSNDTKELQAIFGPAGKEIISSGDQVADKARRERFVKSYEETSKLEKESDNKVTLVVGNDEWPFPVPIVKKNEAWVFDTMAGKEELLDRRIGRNELNTIQTCLAYVDAQREYAMKSWNSDDAYAQKFMSTPGKKDGLYWKTKEGKAPSPLGDLFAKAVKAGYTPGKGVGPQPYWGYYYKILKAQGKDALGGAYDYVIRGKMIGGFALVAYPAEYGASGIMTFIVNHDGVVYQKDLGKETGKIASAMTKYDPDETWKKVE